MDSDTPILTVAEHFRAKSLEELKKLFRVYKASDFKEGAVLAYDSMRTLGTRDSTGKDVERRMVMFRTFQDGGFLKGEMTIPDRCVAEAVKCMPGIIRVGAERVSKTNGYKYTELAFSPSLKGAGAHAQVGEQ